jgi:hypothetical protein
MSVITLPSDGEAEIKPLSAEEEQYLRDPRLLRSGLALDRVMAACVVRLGDAENPDEEALLDLSALDRSVIMLELRKLSYGEEMAFDHACVNPDCGANFPLAFNLDDLKIHPPKTDQPLTLDLPSGAKAVLVRPTGRMERELVKVKNVTDHDFLLKCLESLDGEPPSRAAFLKLSARDLLTMRKEVKAAFGYMDDVALERCPECGTLNRLSLMAHPNFFFPEI